MSLGPHGVLVLTVDGRQMFNFDFQPLAELGAEARPSESKGGSKCNLRWPRAPMAKRSDCAAV